MDIVAQMREQRSGMIQTKVSFHHIHNNKINEYKD